MGMLNTSNIKAIIVDLDRTLLRTDKTLSAYTLNVLNLCKTRGFKIIVATARPFRTTKQYRDAFDFDAMVVSNGARMIYRNQQVDHGICLSTAERELDGLKRDPRLRITLETGECAYSNHPIEDYETVLTNDLVSVARNEGVLKLLVHLDRAKNLDIVKNELTDDLYYTIAHGYLMQIMNTAATKWNGIKTVLDIFQFSPNETVYFGDDQDDIEPIQMCGLGVAVANGIDDVKRVADFIADSNDADGVAKFIEARLLFSENI